MRYLYRPGHPQADKLGFVEAHLADALYIPGRSRQVMSDVEPFRSPIDGSVISSRSHIREHEKRHGVRQIGNDWCGRERPSWWDHRKEIANGTHKEK